MYTTWPHRNNIAIFAICKSMCATRTCVPDNSYNAIVFFLPGCRRNDIIVNKNLWCLIDSVYISVGLCPKTLFERFREQNDVIDLVILDMLMPRKSGLEISEEIKKVWPSVKTLFMSGYSQDILRSKGFSEGGAELLMKPFSRFDLARKVREALDR